MCDDPPRSGATLSAGDRSALRIDSRTTPALTDGIDALSYAHDSHNQRAGQLCATNPQFAEWSSELPPRVAGRSDAVGGLFNYMCSAVEHGEYLAHANPFAGACGPVCRVWSPSSGRCVH